jgi:DNA repair protein RecO (recombination protein O)
MLQNTDAIVLSSLRYKESSLIVSCYTKELGVQSYILHHIFKAKKSKINPAYFQLLTQLEIQTNYKSNQNLHKITEVKLLHAYNSIHTNIYKNTVSMFIAEVLQNILKEEEKNEELYNFLEAALLWYDLNDFNANFHLVFLLKISQYLGIFPDNETLHLNFFRYEKDNRKIYVLKDLLGINFDALNTIKINAEMRQNILNEILSYFSIHLGNFKKPNSLKILHDIFN